MFNSLQPYGLQSARLLCPWESPGKDTGVDCHALLQGIFPIQGSNSHLLHLLHWQMDAFPLHCLGSCLSPTTQVNSTPFSLPYITQTLSKKSQMPAVVHGKDIISKSRNLVRLELYTHKDNHLFICIYFFSSRGHRDPGVGAGR